MIKGNLQIPNTTTRTNEHNPRPNPNQQLKNISYQQYASGAWVAQEYSHQDPASGAWSDQSKSQGHATYRVVPSERYIDEKDGG